MPLNANQFRPMYEKMGINLDRLGCIMIDVNCDLTRFKPDEKDLYYTEHPERFWIKGFVASKTPHVTLLYGLLESGNTTWRDYVDVVLGDWKLDEIQIDHVGYFDSPYTDDPYYCLVAHIRITPELLEGHKRLELLPHINTFLDYNAHLTIAYIRKDEELRDTLVSQWNQALRNNAFLVTGINYGK